MAYNTISFYEGQAYPLDPDYADFKGDRVQFNDLSFPTETRSANQIKSVARNLNLGVKHMEMSVLSPEIFESIPDQHLTEINRMAKLTGTDMTVHGPLIEASGLTQQGWTEVNRQNSERQLQKALERSAKVSPGGIMNTHTSSGLPEMKEAVWEENEGKRELKTKSVYVINPQSGRIDTLKETERHFPGESKEFNPTEELKKRNEEIWDDTTNHMTFNLDRAETHFSGQTMPLLIDDLKEIMTKKIPFEKLDRVRQEAFQNFEIGEGYAKTAYREMKSLFNVAYSSTLKLANDPDGNIRKRAQEDLKKFDQFKEEIKDKIGGISEDRTRVVELANIVRKGFRLFSEMKESPKTFIPLQDFALEKSSETFANVAFNTYDKLKDKAPSLLLENPPAGGGFSKAEDMVELIKKTRDKIEEKAREKGYTSTEAKAIAEKMVGATWDVGHINMLKKYGYTDKDLVEQTKKIAPLVKHVHLSDNFGYDHTELPMGMGNVPFQEELKALKKAGFKGKQVIEAGNWWQHFSEEGKVTPLLPSLQGLGTPLYTSPTPAPYWNQITGTLGSYFGGYGPILPDQHFSMYGAGFSGLPQELGGQIPGKQSRFSGTPTD